jgi:hypothetical protein
MFLNRSSRLFVMAVAAALALALAPLPALAGGPYSLHVKLSKTALGPAMDMSLPWDMERGSSPFDFVSDKDDGPGLERLRAAWSALAHVPEGQSVTMPSDHGTIRASRRAGYLVLEPRNDYDDDKDVRIRVPAGIIEAILHRDGRLTSEDLQSLLLRRNELPLVDIKSNDGRVEVWIDRGEAGDQE